MSNVINMLLFQGAWFACVGGAAAGRWWLGALAVLPLVAHFAYVMRARWSAARISGYLAIFGLGGAALEALQNFAGTYAFVSTGLLWGCVWMGLLWAAFATTLPLGLWWLARRPLLGALGGFVFGPLSYYAGAGLGAIALPPEPARSLLILALVWALALPLARLLLLRGPDFSRVPRAKRS